MVQSSSGLFGVGSGTLPVRKYPPVPNSTTSIGLINDLSVMTVSILDAYAVPRSTLDHNCLKGHKEPIESTESGLGNRS